MPDARPPDVRDPVEAAPAPKSYSDGYDIKIGSPVTRLPPSSPNPPTMCINCVIRQEQEEDERCVLPCIRGSRTDLEDFVRRRQRLKKGKDGQESPTDPETAEEDLSRDQQKTEVVEPEPEPVPSAREEFHRAYTRTLQAADKDVEEHSRTLDSISYPVSVRFPLSPQDKFLTLLRLY